MKNSGFSSSDNKALKFRGILFGVVTGAMIIAALLCLSAVIFVNSKSLPGEYLQYLMLVIDFLGGLAGGYTAARIIKSRGILWGAACGLIIFFIILSAGMSSNDKIITAITAYKLTALTISGILGGIKGVNRKEKLNIK